MTADDQYAKIEQQLDASMHDFYEATATRDPLVSDDSATLERRSYLDGHSDGLAFALAILRGTATVTELERSEARIKGRCRKGCDCPALAIRKAGKRSR